MTTKPIKPRRMWAKPQLFTAGFNADDIGTERWNDNDRRVLVIDLSPESVAALENKAVNAVVLAKINSINKYVSTPALAHAMLAAIGIKAVRRKGRG